MSTPLLLTVPEAAKRLELSESTVWRLVYRGDLESVTIGRARRVPIDSLEAYVDLLSASRGQARQHSSRERIRDQIVAETAVASINGTANSLATLADRLRKDVGALVESLRETAEALAQRLS